MADPACHSWEQCLKKTHVKSRTHQGMAQELKGFADLLLGNVKTCRNASTSCMWQQAVLGQMAPLEAGQSVTEPPTASVQMQDALSPHIHGWLQSCFSPGHSGSSTLIVCLQPYLPNGPGTALTSERVEHEGWPSFHSSPDAEVRKGSMTTCSMPPIIHVCCFE